MSKNTDKQVKTRHEMTKAEWTWFLVRKNKTAYFMIAPFMILFFLFTIIPVFLSLVLSFTSFNMLEWPEFVGWTNYIRLLVNDDLDRCVEEMHNLIQLQHRKTCYHLDFLSRMREELYHLDDLK